MKLIRNGALAALTLFAAQAAPAMAAVETPSFPCNAARLPSEVAICRSDRLAGLDTAMVAIYEALEPRLEGGQRRDLRRSQNAWRASRDACGRQRGCIARHYAERIDELRLALVPGARERERGERRDDRRQSARVEELEAEIRRQREAFAEERDQRAKLEEERDALRAEIARLQAEGDGFGRRRNGFSREFSRTSSGFCSDFVEGQRVSELVCKAEFVRSCEGSRDCTTTSTFTLAGAATRRVTLAFEGDRILLNGRPARRYSDDCYRARAGLYGFCFGSRRGIAMPSRPQPRG